jgi:hypothetical protein
MQPRSSVIFVAERSTASLVWREAPSSGGSEGPEVKDALGSLLCCAICDSKGSGKSRRLKLGMMQSR